MQKIDEDEEKCNKLDKFLHLCRWNHLGGTRNCNPVNAFYADRALEKKNVEFIHYMTKNGSVVPYTENPVPSSELWVGFIGYCRFYKGRTTTHKLVFYSGATSTSNHIAILNDFVTRHSVSGLKWVNIGKEPPEKGVPFNSIKLKDVLLVITDARLA